MAKKPLELDMIAGSQLRDTQGEMLSVEGADISELERGNGRLNDNHGKGFFNSVGRVTKAKKIFKEEDCEDDRQRYYWNQVKCPYIYVRGFLYDDEDHPNAKAAAAILRNIHKADVPLKIKASVEGGVVQRGLKDPSLLARTKIHSVALTFTPANQATLVEPISLDKSNIDEEADFYLIKSVIHLAETNPPSFRHITRDASAEKIHENLCKLSEMLMSTGLYNNIDIPSKEEIVSKALEAKVNNNIDKIKYLLKAAREQEELDKGLKSAIAGAAMLGSVAATQPALAHNKQSIAPKIPKTIQQPTPAPTVPPLEHQNTFKQIASKYPLLGAIGMVESSGAKNYQHKPIERPGSMYEGQQAGGMFGMMPAAAAYILKNDHLLRNKYPKLYEASRDVASNHKIFTDTFNTNPQAAADFAISLYKRMKRKTKTPEMLAHSWNHGLKGTWERYKNEGEDAIKNADYVKAVKQAYKTMMSHKKNVKKTMTAGYGGAGIPTNLSGGGVMQSEALDNKFRYITCDRCGKEQIHSKHQVKCRECGQNFSLETLYKLLHKR